MKIVPLQPVPSQRINVLLASQPCTIDVYQRRTGLFVDIYVNNALVLGGVICQDRNRIVRDAYFGFIGDLAFYDTAATPPGYADGRDPTYDGLGGRFKLIYLEAADLQ